jgi:hypothetical protein
MTDADRVALIRTGNALFNEGKIEEAKMYFLRARYGDGIIRVADHYFYELKKPAAALLLYRHAGYTKKVQEIMESIVAVIRSLLAEDKAEQLEKVFPPAREDDWSEVAVKKSMEPRANPLLNSFLAKYGDKLSLPASFAAQTSAPEEDSYAIPSADSSYAKHTKQKNAPPQDNAPAEIPAISAPAADAFLSKYGVKLAGQKRGASSADPKNGKTDNAKEG